MAPSQLGDQLLLLGQPLVSVLPRTQARYPQKRKARTKRQIPRSMCVGTITPKGFREKTTCAGRKEGWARGLETENWGWYQVGVPFAHSCQLILKPPVITLLQHQLVLAVFSYPLANEDFMVCFQNTSLADQAEDSSTQQTVFIHVWNHSFQRKDNVRERQLAFKEQKGEACFKFKAFLHARECHPSTNWAINSGLLVTFSEKPCCGFHCTQQ